MDKTVLIDKEELFEDKEDILYLYNYFLENGYNPNNLSLELSSSVPRSITNLTGRGFLLSKKVKCDDIAEANIKGAYGYFDEAGIFIPKTIGNDSIFYSKYRNKVLAYLPGYKVPLLGSFDSIISSSISDDLYKTAKFDIDKYFGFCLEQSKSSKRAYKYYEQLLRYMNLVTDNAYTIEHDTIQEKGKELCLIKKKM